MIVNKDSCLHLKILISIWHYNLSNKSDHSLFVLSSETEIGEALPDLFKDGKSHSLYFDTISNKLIIPFLVWPQNDKSDSFSLLKASNIFQKNCTNVIESFR